MKKTLQIALIFALLGLFCIFEAEKNSGSRVIKIITPTKIVVDFNNNRIADDEETVCIPNLETFTANLTINQNELADSLKITDSDAITLGFITDEFAKSQLLNRKVKTVFKSEHTPECKFADVIVDSRDYAKELQASGLAIVDGKPTNSDILSEKLEEGKAQNLVIVNRKSGKFHTLDCKFGLKSSDFLVIPRIDAENHFQKCKFCLKNELQTEHISPAETILPIGHVGHYSEKFGTDGIKFLVSDYTNHLKPDKSCTHEFCKFLLEIINSSEKTLDIAAYDWNNIDQINNALEKAKARGVQIRIVYDKKANGVVYKNVERLVENFSNSRPDEVLNNTKLTSMLMHDKFVISDGKRVFTGSMNFSNTGLSGFNANNVVILDSEPLAQLYTEEFDRMYSGKFHTLKQKSATNNEFNIGDSKVKVYFSPQDKTAENALVPMINNAKSYIYLPVFVITHKSVTTALINAQRRGVDVKIILDATAIRTNHSTHTLLRNNDIKLKIENYAGKIHNKSMIIDDKYVVTGSMNFSNSGENKNDENCLIIENPEIAKFYRGWFEYIWNKIPDKYLKFNVPAESNYSIGSCTDGVDNDFDDKIDADDEGCRTK